MCDVIVYPVIIRLVEDNLKLNFIPIGQFIAHYDVLNDSGREHKYI